MILIMLIHSEQEIIVIYSLMLVVDYQLKQSKPIYVKKAFTQLPKARPSTAQMQA